MKILDNWTLIRRRIHAKSMGIFAKIHALRIKYRAKKIIEILRKNYIKTGAKEITLKQSRYKYDLSAPLALLQEKYALECKVDDNASNRIYYITIKENEYVKNKNIKLRR